MVAGTKAIANNDMHGIASYQVGSIDLVANDVRSSSVDLASYFVYIVVVAEDAVVFLISNATDVRSST